MLRNMESDQGLMPSLPLHPILFPEIAHTHTRNKTCLEAVCTYRHDDGGERHERLEHDVLHGAELAELEEARAVRHVAFEHQAEGEDVFDLPGGENGRESKVRSQ